MPKTKKKSRPTNNARKVEPPTDNTDQSLAPEVVQIAITKEAEAMIVRLHNTGFFGLDYTETCREIFMRSLRREMQWLATGDTCNDA